MKWGSETVCIGHFELFWLFQVFGCGEGDSNKVNLSVRTFDPGTRSDQKSLIVFRTIISNLTENGANI